ncbi:heterokaryon incompatibility, partial [Podospora fimiseda]
VSLDDKPRFSALSYVWGDQTKRKKTSINGQVFKVGKNLYDGLINIQRRISHDRLLPIWIDAICINQDDDTEKSEQVQIMGTIFSQCEFVVSWLGSGGKDSDIASTYL